MGLEGTCSCVTSTRGCGGGGGGATRVGVFESPEGSTGGGSRCIEAIHEEGLAYKGWPATELRSTRETKAMADIAPSCNAGQEGWKGEIVREGSTRNAREGFLYVSKPCCLDSTVSSFSCLAVVEPAPLGFPRVFGAMLTSVPVVSSRALPFVEGSSETVSS